MTSPTPLRVLHCKTLQDVLVEMTDGTYRRVAANGRMTPAAIQSEWVRRGMETLSHDGEPSITVCDSYPLPILH